MPATACSAASPRAACSTECPGRHAMSELLGRAIDALRELLPLGRWVNEGVKLLLDHGATLFDSVGVMVEAFAQWIEQGMLTIPFWLTIAVVSVIGWRRLGAGFGMFALLALALIGVTSLGIRQVSTEQVEAGNAFGCTSTQLLFKVQLPIAMPTIMAGVNQTIMMALSMVIIASMVGAGGLGNDVLASIQRLDIGLGFESGLAVVLLAIILDRLTESFGVARRGRDN